MAFPYQAKVDIDGNDGDDNDDDGDHADHAEHDNVADEDDDANDSDHGSDDFFNDASMLITIPSYDHVALLGHLDGHLLRCYGGCIVSTSSMVAAVRFCFRRLSILKYRRGTKCLQTREAGL